MRTTRLFAALAACFLTAFGPKMAAQRSFSDSLRSDLAKKEDRRWNLFYRELSFPISSILLDGGGGGLSYRKRIERGRMIRLKQTQARRINFWAYASQWIGPKNPIRRDFDTIPPTFQYWETYLDRQFGSSAHGSLSIGHEWQNNLGRFQFFYGADAQGDFRNNSYGYCYGLSTDALNDDKGYFRRNQTASLGAFGFVGVRFFIHPRISISTEGGYFIGASRETDFARLRSGPTVSIGRAVFWRLETSSAARRFFSLNFHF